MKFKIYSICLDPVSITFADCRQLVVIHLASLRTPKYHVCKRQDDLPALLGIEPGGMRSFGFLFEI